MRKNNKILLFNKIIKKLIIKVIYICLAMFIIIGTINQYLYELVDNIIEPLEEIFKITIRQETEIQLFNYEFTYFTILYYIQILITLEITYYIIKNKKINKILTIFIIIMLFYTINDFINNLTNNIIEILNNNIFGNNHSFLKKNEIETILLNILLKYVNILLFITLLYAFLTKLKDDYFYKLVLFLAGILCLTNEKYYLLTLIFLIKIIEKINKTLIIIKK
ncbi:MAG: hypothetical protein KIT69_03035 [Propionibacteriaceae bacterium]|nr:hypothetical protein [Propionibacteriaceae bacterium]